MLVYFVEDDQSISYIIDKTLEKINLDRKGFQTGASFLDAYKEQKPDLILLDIMLPDSNGIELLKQIRLENSEIPIIIVSALFSEMDKVTALDLGADDYITKPFGILELSSRIQAKLRKIPTSNDIEYLDIKMDLKQFKVFSNETEFFLTKKEFEILQYILKRSSEVLTKEQIFFDVWKTSFMGETRALDMHIKAIRQKLSEVNSKVSIDTVYGIGYKAGKNI